MSDMQKLDEEFTNFMHRVTEVNNIVKKLSSNDTEVQNIGTLEADQYLNNKAELLLEHIDEEDIQLRVTSNRTVINKKAIMKEDMDQNQMSQEAFMEEAGKDADRRYKDKLVRKERSDTFKTQATKAFRRGEYERALTLYDKAIEQIKDSCMLYTNRALTQMNLTRYDKALHDVEMAIWLNENSIKARLLLAKLYYITNNMKEFHNAIKEAKERHQSQINFIDEYVIDIKKFNHQT